MSKQRPSTANAVAGGTSVNGGTAGWQGRVFRNSFTRRGRTHRLKGWSFKVQFHGRRHTFSLVARSRSGAAQEAQQIYGTLVTEGWESALQKHSARGMTGRGASQAAAMAAAMENSLEYWEQCLLPARFPEACLTRDAEYSVIIEHEGSRACFLLGSTEPPLAAAKAREIKQTILAEGWAAGTARFEREITLSISWWDNPRAVTYTTWYTFPGVPVGLEMASAGSECAVKPVIVVEPDLTTHTALHYWLSRQPGFVCQAIYPSAELALKALDASIAAPQGLVLINRTAPDGNPLANALRLRWPDLAVFFCEIYGDSHEVFRCAAGVDAGCMFRRCPPAALFDPIQPVVRDRDLTATQAGRRIRHYFQSFFIDPEADVARSGPESEQGVLTYREREILDLISRGYVDKKIAQLLRISIWTVHNHLKNIYYKLGVHNRTEAVLQHLQRSQ